MNFLLLACLWIHTSSQSIINGGNVATRGAQRHFWLTYQSKCSLVTPLPESSSSGRGSETVRHFRILAPKWHQCIRVAVWPPQTLRWDTKWNRGVKKRQRHCGETFSGCYGKLLHAITLIIPTKIIKLIIHILYKVIRTMLALNVWFKHYKAFKSTNNYNIKRE